MFSLRTLGALQLTGPDGEVLAGRRKHLALLAYLARRAPQAVPRGELATLLWEDRGEERAKHSLRQALVDLKRVLGDSLDVSADAAALARGVVELDVESFDVDLASGRPDSAVRRWSGDFLHGLEDLGAEEYRLWVERERSGLRRKLAMALEALIARAEVGAAWAEAVQWGERWVELLPLDERGHIRLIHALRAERRATEALDRHAALVARLREDLGVEPTREILQLGEALEAEAREAQAHAPRSAALFTPDLVGRADPFRELAAAWQSVRDGGAAVVLIEGEAGIGKTRLADEFVRRLQSRESLCVLRARAYEAEGDVAGRAARELLSGLRHAPGLLGAPEWALAALAALVPAIREEFPRLAGHTAGEHTLDDAVARVLSDVASEMPLIAYVDDFPFVDAQSRQLIISLARRPPAGVLLLLTARTEDWGESGGVGELRRLTTVRAVHLQPLALPEVEALLASAVELRAEDRGALAARLHAESGGNPFYAIALLTALAEDGFLGRDQTGTWRIAPEFADRQLPLPAGARAVVERRVARLGDAARRVAGAAAIIGVPFDAALMAKLTGLSPVAAEAAVEELILHRFVRLTGPGAGRYEFAHELARRYVQQAIPVEEREALGRRAAALLEAGEPLDEATLAALARHGARAAAPARPRRRWALVAASLTIAGLVGVGVAVLLQTRSTVPTDLSSIAVLPFSVNGSEELDYLQDGMVTLLSTSLNGVGALRSVDPRAVMGIASQLDGRLPDSERGRRVAERVGAAIYVVGNVVQAGGRIRISAAAYQRGDSASPVARAAVDGPVGQLFELVDATAGRLLSGLSPGPYEQLTRTAASTTSSLPALKAYLEGERLFRSGDFQPAARAFQRAAIEDTTFALAYYWLSVASWWADDAEVIDSAAALAVRYGGRLSERDRRLFQAWETFIRGDALESERVYRQIVGLEPENVEAWLQLGEVLFHSGPRRGGLIGAARAPFQRVLSFEPEHTSALLHLARIAAAEQRRAELDSLTERIIALNPDGEWALEARTLRAYASGDRAEQLRVIADLRTGPEGRIWSIARYVAVATQELDGARELLAPLTTETRPAEVRAFGHVALAYLQVARGRLRSASAELDRAAALDPLPALQHRALLALPPFVPVNPDRLLALRDTLSRGIFPDRATRLATSHLVNLHDAVHPELRAYLIAGLSLRLADTATARASLAELERPHRTPHATIVGMDAAGSIRSQLAHRAGRSAEARSEMEEVQRLEARVGLIGGSPFYSQGLERYLYARMLEDAGRLEEALRWYGSFSHNSIFDFVFLAPSHVARGRISERLGRPREAAAEYGRAAQLLRDADPEMGSLVREVEQGLRRVQE